MIDICKCSNEECKLKEQCKRHTAPSHPYYQAYSHFEPDENGKCPWYISDKEIKIKTK